MTNNGEHVDNTTKADEQSVPTEQDTLTGLDISALLDQILRVEQITPLLTEDCPGCAAEIEAEDCVVVTEIGKNLELHSVFSPVFAVTEIAPYNVNVVITTDDDFEKFTVTASPGLYATPLELVEVLHGIANALTEHIEKVATARDLEAQGGPLIDQPTGDNPTLTNVTEDNA